MRTPAFASTGTMDSFRTAKQSLTLEKAAQLCNATLHIKGSGRNRRVDCPFNCEGDHVGKGELSVNVEHSDLVWTCHNYSCQCRGDIVDLINGLLTRKPPIDGTRGKEFTRVKQLILGDEEAPTRNAAKPEEFPVEALNDEPAEVICNLPLKDSENEAARRLVGMQADFVTDPDEMKPSAAQYWRRREHFLTAEICEEWQVGYVPMKGCSDRRGFSIRGTIAYPLFDVHGNELTFIARDPEFAAKLDAFESLIPEKRSEERKPMKHRFMKGFMRGLEFYGAQRQRFERHPEYIEQIETHGLTIVEGFNDVLALDRNGVYARGLMSNQMTDGQVMMVAEDARRLAKGKVNLFFDCQPAGDDGARDALWRLSQIPDLDVRLMWSQHMYGGQFKGREPEDLTREELYEILLPQRKR